MAGYYVSSTKWNATPVWTASTAYSVGTIVKRPGSSNVRLYRCETAGTSGASEPTWTTVLNATLNDNGVVWRNITGTPSYGWDSAASSIGSAATISAISYQDTIYVDSTHEELNGGTVNGGSALVISVDAAGSVPPVKADYLRGAKARIDATGTLAISAGRFHGLDFVAETGSSQGHINTCNSNSGNFFSDCVFHLKNTNINSQVFFGSTLGGMTEWTNNTKVRFGANQIIAPGNLTWFWNNCPASDTVSSNGVMPTSLVSASNNNGSSVVFRGLNLTGFTGSRYFSGTNGRNILFEDCLLADAPTQVNSNTADQSPEGSGLRFINCSRVSTPVLQGMEALELAHVKALVSSCVLATTPDFGSGKLAERFRLLNAGSQGFPAKSLVLKRWNKVTGTLTATVRGVYFGATLPTKSELVFSATYPNTVGSTSQGVASDFSYALDTTVVASDTADWTAGAPARANSTSYAFGDFVKVASNPGKIFVRENAGSGNSAASEPAGFATAAYGSTVADGSATWRCGIPFKLEASVSPARAGYIRSQAKLFTGSATFTVLNTRLELI